MLYPPALLFQVLPDVGCVKTVVNKKASGLFQVTRYGIYFFVFYSKLFRYTPNTVFVSRMPAAVFMVCSIKDRIACWLYPLSDALTI